MIGFAPHHPIVVDLCNGRWRLHEPLTYSAPDGRAWTIAAGFETDFGSIPAPLEWLPGLKPYGTEGDCPYILHDWLYYCHRTRQDRCKDRADADSILYAALLICGVGRIRAWVIYRAVRMGGWKAWG